ncbi:MAG: dipeptidase [Opitutaceae bacterium]
MTTSEYLEQHRESHLEQLKELIRIPSQSGDSRNRQDIRNAAAWLRDRFEAIGMENATVLETDRHPVVYADWLHAGGQPTVIFYAHYDVQPVDPLDLWQSPPFEPEVRDGRLYGRGASDDKLGVITVLAALETLIAVEGRLPVNVKICFEGEEEIGSPSLGACLLKERKRFAGDLVVSADGGQWSLDTPNLILGLRGATSLELHVSGPSGDLHSGMHGGAVLNPLEAIARILASMRLPDGTIAVDGFYDDVDPIDPQAEALAARVPFDETGYTERLGVPALHGEPGFSTQQRRTSRPTLEINGIWGGFQGEGMKTVIPSEAHAKITCRLVASQNPDRIFHLIREHVERETPVGVRAEVHFGGVRADAYSMSLDHPAIRIARSVLQDLYGKDPYACRIGGAFPSCPSSGKSSAWTRWSVVGERRIPISTPPTSTSTWRVLNAAGSDT